MSRQTIHPSTFALNTRIHAGKTIYLFHRLSLFCFYARRECEKLGERDSSKVFTMSRLYLLPVLKKSVKGATLAFFNTSVASETTVPTSPPRAHFSLFGVHFFRHEIVPRTTG